jgi:hypothetical protein|uniref:PcfJ like protein n=1 Tax=Myoviridae sp. ctiu99 TaxID=2825158 RepID=A0A8S5NV35_9CAUD|nr:MAG TPA: PcfJ like protein [Myoviridae sp. ctiu99]
MQVLGYAHIDRLYEVVQRYDNWYSCDTYYAAQLHVACGCEFKTAWKAGSMSRIDEGDIYTCPRCGKRLVRRTASRPWGQHAFYQTHRNRLVPIDMQFRVLAYKRWVDLEVKYHAVRCTGEHLQVSIHPLRTSCMFTVRADIGRQVLQVISKGKDLQPDEYYVTDIDPVRNPDWPEGTPLRHLSPESYAPQHRREVMQVFTIWRREVERRLAKKLGYRVPSLYVGTSLASGYGLLFTPLQNIAWRLAAPTAPNYDRKQWHSVHSAERETLFSRVLERTRAGKDYATALCDVFHLPQKASVRKALRTGSPFAVVRLAAAHRITSDSNHVLRLAPMLGGISSTRYYDPELWNDADTVAFLHILAVRYGMASVYALLRQRQLSDTLRMYGQLNHRNRKALWDGPRVKMRDLHDSVMTLHDRQTIENQTIEITRVMAALQHRVGPYEFYTPATTLQLVDISNTLHNCVKSYARRAVAHDCIIVGARKHGRIVACIEIRNGAIRQAKLQHNAPAYKDAAFNAALGLWARRHHLQPCDYDMTPPEPYVQKAV